jgi:hypothetical protein
MQMPNYFDNDKETLTVLEDELSELDSEIDRQRLIRARATYRLEQMIKERDRLARHLGATSAGEGAA